MTGLDAINAATRPAPRRDRWGRYLITTPSGKSTGHTRATTWAKTLADTWALTEWSKRVVAVGMARRPDLVALAANKTADDKDALREVIEAAEETGGANEKRRIGTALHEMLEIIDGGGTANVPAQFAPHVVAYRAALESGGVRVIPELIECIAVVDSLTVAGTFDRIVEIGDSWYIADLKTGSDPIKFGAGEIAIQTALYAHADALWNPATETREPMPQVDLTKALIIHLPAGDPTPVCTLHWVDIEAGWQAAQLAGTVRDWRKRKDMASPFVASPPIAAGGETAPGTANEGVDAPPPQLPPRTNNVADDLKGRIGWLVENSPVGVKRLTALWPAGVPTFAAIREAGGAHTDEQLRSIGVVVARVEADVQAPLTPLPAGDLPTLPMGAEAEQIEAWPELHEAHDALDAADRTVFQAWALTGRDHARPWDMRAGKPTRRRLAVCLAACALAPHVDQDDDSLVRTILAAATGVELQTTWRTGAFLGTLTIAQADTARQIAVDIAAGNTGIDVDDAGQLRLVPAAA